MDTKNTILSKPWRNWCFTWINPANDDIANIQLLNDTVCKYIIYGWELTKDGLDHIQGYIELTKATRMCGLKKLLDPINGKKSTIHVEPANSGRKTNKAYCSKGLQSHEEWMEFKEDGPNYGYMAEIYEREFKAFNEGKGKRTDWDKAYKRIVETPDFASILEEFPELAIRYPNGIQKAIDTVINSDRKTELAHEMNELKLYSWELDLIADLEQHPDKRKIMWYVDKIGGCGKSTFAKYLLSKGDCAYFTNGKSADIAHAYNGERIVIFDYTRSIEGRINYEIVEAIKNGVVFASKYNSMLKVNATPHIICFSNFDPDRSKLSQDRWDIRPIDRSNCTYPETEDIMSTTSMDADVTISSDTIFPNDNIDHDVTDILDILNQESVDVKHDVILETASCNTKDVQIPNDNCTLPGNQVAKALQDTQINNHSKPDWILEFITKDNIAIEKTQTLNNWYDKQPIN